jgi:AraC-like DNA-binding protein
MPSLSHTREIPADEASPGRTTMKNEVLEAAADRTRNLFAVAKNLDVAAPQSERVASPVAAQTYSLSMKATRRTKGGLSDFGRRTVIDFVRSRIGEDISLADMATVTGLSIPRFSHTFKNSMGQSPHQFVLQQRVRYSKELLVSVDLRVIDIALDCGFKTQQHFARIFRKMCGLSPTEYKRSKTRRRLRDSDVKLSPNSAGLRRARTVDRKHAGATGMT